MYLQLYLINTAIHPGVQLVLAIPPLVPPNEKAPW